MKKRGNREKKYLPDIIDYNVTTSNSNSVSVENLEDIVDAIQVFTGFDKKTSEEILKSYFSEIRKNLLKGNIVSLEKFGNFVPKMLNVVFGTKEIFRKKINNHKYTEPKDDPRRKRKNK